MIYILQLPVAHPPSNLSCASDFWRASFVPHCEQSRAERSGAGEQCVAHGGESAEASAAPASLLVPHILHSLSVCASLPLCIPPSALRPQFGALSGSALLCCCILHCSATTQTKVRTQNTLHKHTTSGAGSGGQQRHRARAAAALRQPPLRLLPAHCELRGRAAAEQREPAHRGLHSHIRICILSSVSMLLCALSAFVSICAQSPSVAA